MIGADVRVEERYHVPGSQVWQGSRGAQRGNIHLHVLEDVKLGRMTRTRGQCLCPKKGGSYERPVDGDDRTRTFRCPKCETVAERFGIPWPSENPRITQARASHKPGESLIGDRTCVNCGKPLFQHCDVHLIPCCPGQCPGVSVTPRRMRLR